MCGENKKPFEIRTFNDTICLLLTPFAAKRLVSVMSQVDLDGNTVMFTMKKRLRDQISFAEENERGGDGTNGPKDDGRSYGRGDVDFGDEDSELDGDEGDVPSYGAQARTATVRRAVS